MSSLVKKYEGRQLTTDEAAEAQNAITNAIKELESISLKTGPDYLLLKWGTIKGCELQSDKAKELLHEYNKLGTSASVMTQHDTERQKQIICELIDECDGTIQSDWSGEYFTKEQAKNYIMEYES